MKNILIFSRHQSYLKVQFVTASKRSMTPRTLFVCIQKQGLISAAFPRPWSPLDRGYHRWRLHGGARTPEGLLLDGVVLGRRNDTE